MSKKEERCYIMSNQNQAKQIYSELIQSGYTKNDILCVGFYEDNTPYAIILPTFEQLVCEDRLISTKNIIVDDLRYVYMWYSPKEYRSMWCLQYQDLMSQLLENLDFLYSQGMDIQRSTKCGDIPIIKEIMLNIFSLHYKLNDSKVKQWCNKETFFKQLTYAEKDALKYISEEVGAEGDISISKMIEKYPISRPVWNNLFKKIQEFEVGEITNKGVKGTHINIAHPQLRYDAEHHKI